MNQHHDSTNVVGNGRLFPIQIDLGIMKLEYSEQNI